MTSASKTVPEISAGSMNVLDRLIHLRSIPDLADVSAAGMKFLAQETTERTLQQGEQLYGLSSPVSCIHFLVEGSVSVEFNGQHMRMIEAPGRLGFVPALAAQDVHWVAKALEPTRTLEFAERRLRRLLAMDPSFFEMGVRQLSRRMLMMQKELSAKGLLRRSQPKQSVNLRAPLDSIDRLFRIRVGPYADATGEALYEYASRMTEVRFEPGDLIWNAGEASDWGLHIVSGVVGCDEGEAAFQMGSGSIIGELEAFGDVPRRYRAEAASEVVGLCAKRDAFFDVAETNRELGEHFVTYISSSLVKLQAKLLTGSATDSDYQMKTPGPARGE